MDCRPFEITLIGANDIKDVNMFSKMDVFAVVTVTGPGVAKQKHRTPVHKDGGTNPRWNHTIKLNLDDAALSSDRVKIKINLVSQRAMGDTKIGKSVIPAKELLQGEKANGGEKPVSYVIVTPKGRTKGNISFCYKFGEKFSAPLPVQPEAYKSGPAHEPVMAYPAGHAGPSSGYPPQAYQAYPPQQAGYAPPQQAGYGYAPPPQTGYGYAPPQQGGYGYPPVVQPGYGYAQKPQKPKKGGNMALGLGAGLLGGLLIGDMVSDVGDMAAYDAGYGDGFGDGFDF